MKANIAQIYLDGVLILSATDLQYDGTKKKLGGLLGVTMHGSVSSVDIPKAGTALATGKPRILEIRYNGVSA